MKKLRPRDIPYLIRFRAEFRLWSGIQIYFFPLSCGSTGRMIFLSTFLILDLKIFFCSQLSIKIDASSKCLYKRVMYVSNSKCIALRLESMAYFDKYCGFTYSKPIPLHFSLALFYIKDWKTEYTNFQIPLQLAMAMWHSLANEMHMGSPRIGLPPRPLKKDEVWQGEGFCLPACLKYELDPQWWCSSCLVIIRTKPQIMLVKQEDRKA